MKRGKRENWYFLDTGHRSPYFNMAMDEALMQWAREKRVIILRFFNFRPRSVTIGYLQKVEDWLIEIEKKGILWVRRPTGGRAVFHSHDFTYSLIFPEHHPLIGGSVLESYKKIASAFYEAFNSIGLNPVLASKRGNNENEYCFSAPSRYEFIVKGKKIIGSAQFRNKGIALQQGTIMLDNPGKPFPAVKGMITVKEAVGRYFTLQEMKEAVYAAFKRVFSVRFIPVNYEFYIEELLNKYKSYEWNYTR